MSHHSSSALLRVAVLAVAASKCVARRGARLVVQLDGAWRTIPVRLEDAVFNATEKARAFCGAEDDVCVTQLTAAVEDVDTFLYYELCGELEQHLMRNDVNPDLMEGHTATWLAKVKTLRAVARAAPPNATACEVGFNAGHSSLNFLSARPDLSVVAFDRATQTAPALSDPSRGATLPYAPHGVSFVLEHFPERFVLVAGDSTLTMPAAAARFSSALRCDVLFVDGAHETEIARADLVNGRALVDATKWNRVIVDDIGDGATWQTQVKHAWEAALRDHVVTEELYRIPDAAHATCRLSPVRRCEDALEDGPPCACPLTFFSPQDQGDGSDKLNYSHRNYCCAAECQRLQENNQDAEWTDLVAWVPTPTGIDSFGPCRQQPPALHPDLPTTCQIAVGRY